MRVIYVNFFSPDLVSGGIKVAYRCVEALQESGYDASVWQPGGVPSWLNTTANVISEKTLRFAADDILVFPEVLEPRFLNMLKQLAGLTKILFCQNHINIFNNTVIPPYSPRELGFDRILCVSHVSKGFLERAFAYDDIAVMPVAVDPAVFRPREKKLQIAFAPRKLRQHADIIRKLFVTKYSDMCAIPWQSIEGLPEAGVAEVMGDSAVYLALGQFESCPLMPLEAMSAGCAVVGYHGYGGLEYATPANGFWHNNDEIEEVVDNLYRTITGIQHNDKSIRAMIVAGQATAARFNAAAMSKALVGFIESVRQ